MIFLSSIIRYICSADTNCLFAVATKLSCTFPNLALKILLFFLHMDGFSFEFFSPICFHIPTYPRTNPQAKISTPRRPENDNWTKWIWRKRTFPILNYNRCTYHIYHRLQPLGFLKFLLFLFLFAANKEGKCSFVYKLS